MTIQVKRHNEVRDGGYALVAAVTAVAAFAYIAFQVLAADRGEIAEVAGRSEQARLSAAADAGVMIAIHGLGAEDRASRWSIDGRARQADFAGAALTISVQDERGKAPLAGLSESQSRALFAGGGASGDRLDALVREFRDWINASTPDPRLGAADTSGSDTTASAAPGLAPRQGPFRTVGELMGLRDMDAGLYGRIAPAVTTFFEEGGPFDPAYASPLAIQTMAAREASDQEGTPDALFSAARPDEDIVDDHLVGRTLTVEVTARDRAGGQARRTAIVELTGGKDRPYWVRYVE